MAPFVTEPVGRAEVPASSRPVSSGSVEPPTTVTGGVVGDSRGFSLRSAEEIGYRVDLVDGLLSPDNDSLAEALVGRQVVALSSATVGRLYGQEIRRYLERHLPAGSWSLHTLPTGEHNKSLQSVEAVCALAYAEGLDRRGVLLAVGGGITTDIVGFAAATYARGIDYVKVNTTLVGQVDVGVGIKTGVNAYGAKNMLGAYHPAIASFNDPAFLRTLPSREIACGMAEILKMAIIRDARLFDAIECAPDVFSGGRSLTSTERRVLRRAMELMLEELCPNLHERVLARLVDFGHTFGPMIETASGYRIAHGESVAIDIALSSHVARLTGRLDDADCARIVRLLRKLGLPTFDPQTCTVATLDAALTSAWRRRGRRLHLVVPSGIGTGVFLDDLDSVPQQVLAEAVSALAAEHGEALPRRCGR